MNHRTFQRHMPLIRSPNFLVWVFTACVPILSLRGSHQMFLLHNVFLAEKPLSRILCRVKGGYKVLSERGLLPEQ